MCKDDQQSISDAEIANMLWTRWNHLESLLVTAILAMFVTTTVAVFGAIQTQSKPLSSIVIILGGAAAYAVLGGYYYFILTQNYAVTGSLLKLDRRAVVKFKPLWEYFTPESEDCLGPRHRLQLRVPTFVPLIITVVAMTALLCSLPNKTLLQLWSNVASCFVAVATQVVLYFTMMRTPFRKIISDLEKFENNQGSASPDIEE